MEGLTRKELLELLNSSGPRTRKTVVRTVEGKVSQDGVSFVKESLGFMQPDGTVRSIELIGTFTCGCGHLTDQQTRLLSVCTKCGNYTCSSSSPQCSFTCQGCGKSFCRQHISVYADGECYCSKCRWRKWLRCFFDLKKRSKS